MSGGRGEVGEGGGRYGSTWMKQMLCRVLSMVINTDKGCLKGSAWDG